MRVRLLGGIGFGGSDRAAGIVGEPFRGIKLRQASSAARRETGLTHSAPVPRLRPRRKVWGYGAIAQLGERYNGIVEVAGSIPAGSTISPFDYPSSVPIV
jgi:hypothetical protein